MFKPNSVLNARITLFIYSIHIEEMLAIILKNIYFTFEGQVFLQSEGLPMGCSVSGILAMLFIDELENIALSSHRFIKPYKRYVEDIYLQKTRENTAEIEKPTTSTNGLSLPFLDSTVTISDNGESSFELSKKPAKNHSLPTTPQHYPGTPKSTLSAMNDNAYNRGVQHRRHRGNTTTPSTIS